MSDAWRVAPTTPVSMAVVIDAWVELAIQPASLSGDRIDLIAERVFDNGGREYQAVIAAIGVGRPPTPPGYTRIATVHVGRGQQAIAHCHIGD